MSDVRGAATAAGRVIPYALVFGVAAFLLYRANHFEFTAAADQIGPDNWPKLILFMIMATSAFEGVRRLLTARNIRSGPAAVPIVESPFEREHADMRIVLTCVAVLSTPCAASVSAPSAQIPSTAPGTCSCPAMSCSRDAQCPVRSSLPMSGP